MSALLSGLEIGTVEMNIIITMRRVPALKSSLCWVIGPSKHFYCLRLSTDWNIYQCKRIDISKIWLGEVWTNSNLATTVKSLLEMAANTEGEMITSLCVLGRVEQCSDQYGESENKEEIL